MPRLSLVGPGECAEASTPRLCLRSDPDRPLELRVGKQSVLPGECVAWPPDAAGGSIRVVVLASDEEVSRRRVVVSRGTETWVQMDARARVSVRNRACSAAR